MVPANHKIQFEEPTFKKHTNSIKQKYVVFYQKPKEINQCYNKTKQYPHKEYPYDKKKELLSAFPA